MQVMHITKSMKQTRYYIHTFRTPMEKSEHVEHQIVAFASKITPKQSQYKIVTVEHHIPILQPHQQQACKFC